MIPTILEFLQSWNDPKWVIYIVLAYVASYYVVSGFFHFYASKAGYAGFWHKNGPVDVLTSGLWCPMAIVLILSLLDLLIRNELSLGYLLIYYGLLILLFAFVYNIIEWHFPGTIDGLKDGWTGELQCLMMSVQVITTASYTSAKPAGRPAELVAVLQSLLGVALVAIFIAKAVALLVVLGVESK